MKHGAENTAETAAGVRRAHAAETAAGVRRAHAAETAAGVRRYCAGCSRIAHKSRCSCWRTPSRHLRGCPGQERASCGRGARMGRQPVRPARVYILRPISLIWVPSVRRCLRRVFTGVLSWVVGWCRGVLYGVVRGCRRFGCPLPRCRRFGCPLPNSTAPL